jgi:uncharacterized RDD family membrane protein YckC
VDYLICLIAIIVIIVLISLIDPSLSHFSKLGEKWATALFTFVPFLLYWGYFTLFEAYWNGRTPGKRVAKIRVIQRSGRGIGLFESMTRNFLRIVDQFPLVYGVGVASILLTREHQRLGDLAAGTLVVHEREELTAPSSGTGARTLIASVYERTGERVGERAGDQPIVLNRRPSSLELPSSSLQRLGMADLEVLEGFFARRLDFSLETRAKLAHRIAAAIQVKTGLEVPPEMSTETYLEEIAHQLRDLVRMR